MPWIDHPKFQRVRDEVLESIRRKEYQFRKVRPIIFLCGGSDSLRRRRIYDFLRKAQPHTLVFYADDVWPLIANIPGADALAMEKELAILSDVVIVIVESPGTFTELGAFSLYDPLRKKLLAILNKEHKGAESFIRAGPVKAINQDSQFAPVIWADFAVILSCAGEITLRLEKLPGLHTARVPNLVDSEKHLLFFLCDLVAIFGPCSVSDVRFYSQAAVGDIALATVARLLALAKAMDLVKTVDLNGETHYARPLKHDEFPSFQETEYLSLPNQRAQILSRMLMIPEAAAALDQVHR